MPVFFKGSGITSLPRKEKSRGDALPCCSRTNSASSASFPSFCTANCVRGRQAASNARTARPPLPAFPITNQHTHFSLPLHTIKTPQKNNKVVDPRRHGRRLRLRRAQAPDAARDGGAAAAGVGRRRRRVRGLGQPQQRVWHAALHIRCVLLFVLCVLGAVCAVVWLTPALENTPQQNKKHPSKKTNNQPKKAPSPTA